MPYYLSEENWLLALCLCISHLEENPEYQFYPLFRMFESCRCQDENRHGDMG